MSKLTIYAVSQTNSNKIKQTKKVWITNGTLKYLMNIPKDYNINTFKEWLANKSLLSQKVMINNKVIFTIESTKISKKERNYLQTVDGFNFMLAQAKLGIKSLNSFRNELKKNFGEKPTTKPKKLKINKTKSKRKLK